MKGDETMSEFIRIGPGYYINVADIRRVIALPGYEPDQAGRRAIPGHAEIITSETETNQDGEIVPKAYEFKDKDEISKIITWLEKHIVLDLE